MRTRFILYIEDDPDQLQLVQMLLERELPDVMVDVCCTSRGAEVFLNERCYDVVILDVALPGELGTDIAAKIRERDAEQPIYLMSEYTGEKWEAEARRVGLKLQRKFSQKDPIEFVADIKQLMEQRPCDNPPGALGEAAEPRAPAANGENAGDDVTHGNSADEISRPAKPISLTSPNVQEARAAIGKVA